ncbi:hypothetical protein MB27_17045 [Actinoplanes utahensis]|uniref:SnoaL-like domain-containing protein n=1 Tax=Actinoplanes utahensis TaxID=1869 RepID=A0A0A6UMX9_ACTUT|nr:hypothetical protein MB27_17045 [Actinoplanes utahensis]
MREVPAGRRWQGWAGGLALAVAAVIGFMAVDADEPSGARAGASPDSPERRQRLVDELLERRAAAFSAGDEAAWLADVDPRHPEIVAYERSRFRNLQGLRPSFFRLFPGGGYLGDGQSEPARGHVYVRQMMRLPDDTDGVVNIHTWSITFRDGEVVVTGIRAFQRP